MSFFGNPLRLELILLCLFFLLPSLHAAEWQWSIPQDNGRVFLWIPPSCAKVRGVVVGQNNMIEEGILEHPLLRQALSELGFAEVWFAPPFDGVFHFDQGAGDQFDAAMKGLAEESGYQELTIAPIVPIGHSACASYPWNFAAWNPARTLAILSVHGDAPQTNRTGSSHPNPDWGNRNIDGIPGLMVMGEYEWVEDRLLPALQFEQTHPKVPLAMLAEPGNGHFNYSDSLIRFLAMFIRKAAEARLPADFPGDKPPALKPVDPQQGWLVERWHLPPSPQRSWLQWLLPSPPLYQPRTVAPAPYAQYLGDRRPAFWCFDEEMAQATQNYFADQAGKLPQLIDFTENGKAIIETKSLEQIRLHFSPLNDDGITFRLTATFLNQVEAWNPNMARWAYLPVGSALGHASGGGPIQFSVIVGPARQIGADTFTLALNRMSATQDRRNQDIWLLASHPGDNHYKSIVQQALMKLPSNHSGQEQHLTFPAIPNQVQGTTGLELKATSNAGLPVCYYVREGPAEISGSHLTLLPIPPRAKYPVKITVTAWQWGRSTPTQVKTAEPVTQTFFIIR